MSKLQNTPSFILPGYYPNQHNNKPCTFCNEPGDQDEKNDHKFLTIYPVKYNIGFPVCLKQNCIEQAIEIKKRCILDFKFREQTYDKTIDCYLNTGVFIYNEKPSVIIEHKNGKFWKVVVLDEKDRTDNR